jgi:hypothetical protein
MLAWIDRTNDGLSWMPADGISLPAKGGLRHVLLGRLEVRLPQPLDSAKGGHDRLWHFAGLTGLADDARC